MFCTDDNGYWPWRDCCSNHDTFTFVTQKPVLIVSAVEEICSEPVKPGPCFDELERYYYDREEEMCKSFIYGGCDGNLNNFETLEACNAFCPDSGKY